MPQLDQPPAPAASGGRALAVIAALVAGLIAGVAGGFFIGQQSASIPAPRSATEAVAPLPTSVAQPQTYTDAPIAEDVREPAEAEPNADLEPQTVAPSPVRRAVRSADPGSLQIASRPSGAQVLVDDVRVGVTPMSLAGVSAGSHRVSLQLSGFRRWTMAVRVDSGARARVGASLGR